MDHGLTEYENQELEQSCRGQPIRLKDGRLISVALKDTHGSGVNQHIHRSVARRRRFYKHIFLNLLYLPPPSQLEFKVFLMPHLEK